MSVELSIKGLQEAQQANLRLGAAVRPDGLLGRVVKTALLEAHRRTVANTPHDTGSLRASHRIDYGGGLEGRISIDPGARNPRSKTPPVEYGVILHAQGMRPGLRSGIRAFYQYTVEYEGEAILRAAGDEFVRGLS